MKKTLLFIATMMLFVACNNEPDDVSLIGTWSEPYHVADGIRVMTFNEDGSMIYQLKHDTTMWIQLHWAPKEVRLSYLVTDDDKLCFSGRGRHIDYEAQKIDTVPFEFLTDYTIKGKTLIVDSFSYDGGLETNFMKSITLYKQ